MVDMLPGIRRPGEKCFSTTTKKCLLSIEKWVDLVDLVDLLVAAGVGLALGDNPFFT